MGGEIDKALGISETLRNNEWLHYASAGATKVHAEIGDLPNKYAKAQDEAEGGPERRKKEAEFLAEQERILKDKEARDLAAIEEAKAQKKKASDDAAGIVERDQMARIARQRSSGIGRPRPVLTNPLGGGGGSNVGAKTLLGY